MKNDQLVARIKELWERNLSQAEMLRVLNEEDGFDIKQRELVRVRTKNRWLLRTSTNDAGEETEDTQEFSVDTPVDPRLGAPSTPNQPRVLRSGIVQHAVPASSESPGLDPVEAARREDRRRRMEAESAERYATRKRRRRTRGYAGMPADPPGPPRFPSETTLDESKSILGLDRQLYQTVRENCQRICEAAGVLKKTIAGPEKWEIIKERLIATTPHLQSVIWMSKDNIETKKLALDVICSDVTKRMRGGDRRLLLADAKNILGLNPENSRTVRAILYRILKSDQFTTKTAMGAERFEALKQQWIAESPVLQRVLADTLDGKDPQMKRKALDALARDIMKRLRDDITRRDPNKKNKEAARALQEADDDYDDAGGIDDSAYMDDDHEPARLLPANVIDPDTGMPIDSQLGSELLLAAVDQPYLQGFEGQQASAAFQTPSQPANDPVAIFLRPHRSSTFPVETPLWISMLNSHSVQELRQVAVAKYPAAVCLRLEGVLKDGKGGELTLQIETDAQLSAYLTHERGSPTFNVQLVHGWKPA